MCCYRSPADTTPNSVSPQFAPRVDSSPTEKTAQHISRSPSQGPSPVASPASEPSATNQRLLQQTTPPFVYRESVASPTTLNTLCLKERPSRFYILKISAKNELIFNNFWFTESRGNFTSENWKLTHLN